MKIQIVQQKNYHIRSQVVLLPWKIEVHREELPRGIEVHSPQQKPSPATGSCKYASILAQEKGKSNPSSPQVPSHLF